MTGSIGEPKEVNKRLVYAELRGIYMKYGYSIRFTHDTESHDSGIDLPIYVVRDKDGILNGGVRAGWTHTKDGSEFILGIFVHSSFGLFP